MKNVRKYDKVKILWGKDKGKEGEVIKVEPSKGRVLVAKINLAKRHTRPQGQGQTGGIKDKEMFLPVGKVMLIDPDTKKPTRPKFDRLSDGTKIRLCRATGTVIPEPKKR
ncbi:MAG: 50S ribosomal protein L24 [Elusimicrobia bacterium]|nr:50S ribosomal protein L24 [Elusimicrobiota bacterium]